MLVYLVALIVAVVLAVQILRLYFADADLTLIWLTRFGHKPGSLAGKVVIITGASSGIGEYLAYELAQSGCRLVLTARRVQELERVKQQCIAKSHVNELDIMIIPFDIMERSLHASAVADILKEFGQIDILVNNAGRALQAMVVDTEMAVDDEIVQLNFLSVVSFTKAVLPHMKERQQGLVVPISSVGGKIGMMHCSTYCATKHAIHGWFSSLRQEVYADGIAVTIACPGPVFSNIRKHAFTGIAGKEYGGVMHPDEGRMKTSRCAYLIAVAMANRLEECWISQHPVLAIMYGAQYLPSYAIRYLCRTMSKNMDAVKAGKHPMHSQKH